MTLSVGTERFTDAIAHTRQGYPFIYCNRSKCDNEVPVNRAPEWMWKLDDTAVVVSTEDGDKKYVYCSVKCAATALLAMARKDKEKES